MEKAVLSHRKSRSFSRILYPALFIRLFLPLRGLEENKRKPTKTEENRFLLVFPCFIWFFHSTAYAV